MQTYSHTDLASYIQFSRGVSLSRRSYPPTHISAAAFDLVYQKLIQQLADSPDITGHVKLSGQWSTDYLFVVKGHQVRVAPFYGDWGTEQTPFVHEVSVDTLDGDIEPINHVMRELRVIVRDLNLGVLVDDAVRYLQELGIPVPAGYVVETL